MKASYFGKNVGNVREKLVEKEKTVGFGTRK